MKITVGRLKTIINEELELFQEKHLEPGDPGHDKDYEEKTMDLGTSRFPNGFKRFQIRENAVGSRLKPLENREVPTSTDFPS